MDLAYYSPAELRAAFTGLIVEPSNFGTAGPMFLGRKARRDAAVGRSEFGSDALRSAYRLPLMRREIREWQSCPCTGGQGSAGISSGTIAERAVAVKQRRE